MSLALLYAKAAVAAVGPRSASLPDTVLRRQVTVDRAHLAAYDRVCGFRLGDTLPAPYPHVLGFGLQVELMASRAFPFALPGLVHMRNTITAHRPLGAAEPLALAVHAERLRTHPKGAQVDLVTAATVGDETVWEGRSTYFSRGSSAPEAGAEPPAPAPVAGGPPVAVWRIDARTGRRYARVSGDVNPIHLSPVTARAFGFPRAIAHGMWTAAHALAAVSGRLPDAFTWDVVFAKPVLLPSTVQLRSRRVAGGWDLGVAADTPTVTHLDSSVRASPAS